MGDEDKQQEGSRTNFSGKYDHVKSEGLEDFMRENGVFCVDVN